MRLEHLFLLTIVSTIVFAPMSQLERVSVNDADLMVEIQPLGNPAWVSEEAGTLTQFTLAMWGIGLLAHSDLAGKDILELSIGDRVVLSYSDGIEAYVVSDILKYRAIEPESTRSDFVDLGTGEVLTVQQLFKKVYGVENMLTLQTCIEIDGNPIGGRVFVIAFPLRLK